MTNRLTLSIRKVREPRCGPRCAEKRHLRTETFEASCACDSRSRTPPKGICIRDLKAPETKGTVRCTNKRPRSMCARVFGQFLLRGHHKSYTSNMHILRRAGDLRYLASSSHVTAERLHSTGRADGDGAGPCAMCLYSSKLFAVEHGSLHWQIFLVSCREAEHVANAV